MVLADSNVLIDIFGDDPSWGSWSKQAIRDAIVMGVVGINPVIYAEVSVRFADRASLDAGLNELMLERFGLPYEAGFLAGRAFRRYRQAGGVRSAPLPDFFIGAHAEVAEFTVLTRDVARYRTYFPSVRLVSPTDLH